MPSALPDTAPTEATPLLSPAPPCPEQPAQDPDSITAVPETADVEAPPAAPSTKPKKSEKDKGRKAVADMLKTDMAAERTFFKWLWTGLHTGAIGTFIFVTFDNDKSDPYRVAVVAFAWAVAFALVLYGLYAYNKRRAALRSGVVEELPVVTREYGPCIVVVSIALVVCAGLAYALYDSARLKSSHNPDVFLPV